MQLREGMEPAAAMMTKRNIRNPRFDSENLDHEELFQRLLALERKRSARTGEPFLLVQIHCEALIRAGAERSIGDIGIALAASVRITDVTGWYRNRFTIGLIFTSFNGASQAVVKKTISGKIEKVLRENLQPAEVGHAEVSFHFFPQGDESGQVGAETKTIPGPAEGSGDISQKSFPDSTEGKR